MMAIITQVRELDRRMRFGMGSHPVQGHPSITVTDVAARTASLNAVPDQFTIFIDRRMTLSEPRAEVVAQIKGLIPDYLQDEIHVEELFYDTPSYTGFVFPVAKFYPPWLLEEAHPLTQAGQCTIEALWGEQRPLGTWDFSTNGTYWAGKAGIPSIGFGPGDEKFAHTSYEQVPLNEVVAATEFYALFPKMLGGKVK
jgi:putative selenium metabolism hydrolase